MSIQSTLYFVSSVSGNVSAPENAIGNIPSKWTTDGNSTTSWTHTWQLDTIAGNNNAIGTQTITLRMRKGTNTNDPTVTSVTLFQNGSSLGILVLSSGSTTISSTTGQDLVYTFDGSLLSGLGAVDIQVATLGVGGSSSQRNAVEISMGSWGVTYEEVVVTQDETGGSEQTVLHIAEGGGFAEDHVLGGAEGGILTSSIGGGLKEEEGPPVLYYTVFETNTADPTALDIKLGNGWPGSVANGSELSRTDTGSQSFPQVTAELPAGFYKAAFVWSNGIETSDVIVSPAIEVLDSSQNSVGGSEATVAISAEGIGTGNEVATSGSEASLIISGEGQGIAAETISGGSSATIEIHVASGYLASESVSSGSEATLQILAYGSGVSSEQGEALSGGSAAIVNISAIGAGIDVQQEAHLGGSEAIVVISTTSGYIAVENASSGSEAAIVISSVGSGFEASGNNISQGSQATITIQATGSYEYYEAPPDEFAGGSIAYVQIAPTGGYQTVEHASGGYAAVLEIFGLGAGVVTQEGAGQIKYWTGTYWRSTELRRWDGSAWVPVNMKLWNGSAWIQL